MDTQESRQAGGHQLMNSDVVCGQDVAAGVGLKCKLSIYVDHQLSISCD